MMGTYKPTHRTCRRSTRSNARRLFAIAALLLGTNRAAYAIELFTPVSQSGDGSAIRCVIVNVGSKPIEVSSTLLSSLDGNILTDITTCPASPNTLAAGVACTSNGSSEGVHGGYCHFTAKGNKVRAGLIIVNSNNDVTSTLPATTK